MPTITVRPSSTLVNYGSINGAATVHGATSDDSDASYVELSSAVSPSFVEVQCSAVSLPAGGVWKSVRARMRVKSSAGGASFGIGVGYSSTNVAFSAFATGSFTEVSSPLITPLAGGPQPRCSARAYSTQSGTIQVAEFYFDAIYAAQPSVAVTAPTGTVTTTTQPLAEWTHTAGADGGSQSAAQVRIYNAAQYGAAGFNPDFSAPFWGTDVVGSANSVTPGVQLVDDNYRVYVRTAQSVNGANHWSSWDFEAFTISTSPPPAPTIAVTPQDAKARNRITVTIDPLEASVVQVQRSADSGATWTSVRGATRVDVVGSTWVGYDHETAGNGATTAYRAQAIRPTINGDIASAWSTTATSTWTSLDVWLKDPERPSRNRIITLMDPAPQPVRPVRKTDHDIIGRATPIPVSDVRGSARGTLQIETYDLAEQAAIITLFDDAPVLLLQTPAEFGLGSLYISPGDLQENLPTTQLVQPWRAWPVPYVVVDEPADAGIASAGGITLDDFGALYTYPADIPAGLTFDDMV